MLTKYATAEVIAVEANGRCRAPRGMDRTAAQRFAHRHAFEYEPREGYIYVRSRAISSRTNDNFDHFPAAEIKKAYRSFIGKPVFVNHANDDITRARGFIIDAALHEDTNPDGTEDTWVEVLMEVDGTKFPKLADLILAGEVDRTSMGTDVQYSVCSVCGNKATTPVEYCQHIPAMKGQVYRRRRADGSGYEETLVYESCYGLGFFENSILVEPPADPTAFFLGVENHMAKAASRKEGQGSYKLMPHTKPAPHQTDQEYWSGWEHNQRGFDNGEIINLRPPSGPWTDGKPYLPANFPSDTYEEGYRAGFHAQPKASMGTDHYYRGYADGVEAREFDQAMMATAKGEADFDETKVNRANDGKFAPKGQGGGAPSGGDSGSTDSGEVEIKEPQEQRAEPGADPNADLDVADPSAEPAPYEPKQPPTGSGTKDDPIVTDDVEEAVKALFEDKHVNLSQPRVVTTMLGKLREAIEAIKEEGGDSTVNLCNVTVKGTNMFCTETQGIPRIQMPQLKTKVVLDDSRAKRELEQNEWGEYDMQPAFRKMLEERGVAVEDTEEMAAYLKPTQSELNGGKVARMLDALQGGKQITGDHIFVSNDNYILDGHHRWAAFVSHDAEDNELGNQYSMPIQRIDLDAISLYHEAMKFTEEWGAPTLGLEASRKTGGCCGGQRKIASNAASQVGQRRFVHTNRTQKGVGIKPDMDSGAVAIGKAVAMTNVQFDVRRGRVESIRRRTMRSMESEGKWTDPDYDAISATAAEARSLAAGAVGDIVAVDDEAMAMVQGMSRCDFSPFGTPHGAGVFVDLDTGQVLAGADTYVIVHRGGKNFDSYYSGGKPSGERPLVNLNMATGQRQASRTASDRVISRVPDEVDTLRNDFCPLDSDECPFEEAKGMCGLCDYRRPPQFLMEPDLEKSKMVDQLREDPEMVPEGADPGEGDRDPSAPEEWADPDDPEGFPGDSEDPEMADPEVAVAEDDGDVLIEEPDDASPFPSPDEVDEDGMPVEVEAEDPDAVEVDPQAGDISVDNPEEVEITEPGDEPEEDPEVSIGEDPEDQQGVPETFTQNDLSPVEDVPSDNVSEDPVKAPSEEAADDDPDGESGQSAPESNARGEGTTDLSPEEWQALMDQTGLSAEDLLQALVDRQQDDEEEDDPAEADDTRRTRVSNKTALTALEARVAQQQATIRRLARGMKPRPVVVEWRSPHYATHREPFASLYEAQDTMQSRLGSKTHPMWDTVVGLVTPMVKNAREAAKAKVRAEMRFEAGHVVVAEAPESDDPDWAWDSDTDGDGSDEKGKGTEAAPAGENNAMTEWSTGESDSKANQPQASRRTADVNNPAQPVPDPASEAPAQTREEAMAPDAEDDPREVGGVPGQETVDIGTDADVESVGGVDLDIEQDGGFLGKDQDVEAPVAGTEVHDDNGRVEYEVRVTDPASETINDAQGVPGVGGDGKTGSNAHVFAALRLARLRIQSGIASGSDLTLGQKIASEMTADDIRKEIGTLEAVAGKTAQAKTAKEAKGKGLVPRRASAQPRPSFAPSAPAAGGSAPSGSSDDFALFE